MTKHFYGISIATYNMKMLFHKKTSSRSEKMHVSNEHVCERTKFNKNIFFVSFDIF